MRLLFNWKNEVLVSLFLRIFFRKGHGATLYFV